MSEAGLRALASRPGYQPERDAVVVDAAVDGVEVGLTGWADVHLHPGAHEADLMIAVDPDSDTAVRDALLDAALKRAKTLGAASTLTYVQPGDTATIDHLDSRGAISVPGYLRLQGELSSADSEPQLPTGWQLEPHSATKGAKGIERTIAAITAAWGDLPGHKPVTTRSVEEAVEAFGAEGNVNVLGVGGTPVGVVRWLVLESGGGYIDAPGIAAQLRQRSVYAALFGVAAARLLEVGATSATMESWGDPPEARAAWRSLGWREVSASEGRRFVL